MECYADPRKSYNDTSKFGTGLSCEATHIRKTDTTQRWRGLYEFFRLRHPEGIIFKHLPDYRRELAEIYQMIKPFGLTDRAIRSIEDVTNPCLNSINEKCARIRGAFISQFDEKLAQHYYIYGERGEAKKISLPRELVTWE